MCVDVGVWKAEEERDGEKERERRKGWEGGVLSKEKQTQVGLI